MRKEFLFFRIYLLLFVKSQRIIEWKKDKTNEWMDRWMTEWMDGRMLKKKSDLKVIKPGNKFVVNGWPQ